jgi:hypothetical protein
MTDKVAIITPQEGAAADSLAASAERIHNGMALMRSGLENYIEGVLQAAAGLASARKAFPSNKAFGEWCRDNSLGEDVLNKDERAALVDFGGDIDRARQVLEASESKSLQLIHIREWKPRPLSAQKTAGRTAPSPPPAKKAPVQNAEDNVLRDVIDKFADGRWRTMSKMETALRYAPSAIRDALKRLGDAARTQRGDGDLEYVIDGDRQTLLVRSGLIEAPGVPEAPETPWAPEAPERDAADANELAALRAENIVLTQKVAGLKDLLARKDREIIELRARLEQPGGGFQFGRADRPAR